MHNKQHQLTLNKNTLHNYYKTNINNKKEDNDFIKHKKHSMNKSNYDFNYKNNATTKKRNLHSINHITEIIDLTSADEIIIKNKDNSIINLLSDDDKN